MATVMARLTNKAPGPRGVWASGQLVDIAPGDAQTLTFADERELEEVDRSTFRIETSDDIDFDASPDRRLFLALADDEDHAGFRFIDVGTATHLGMAVGVASPLLPSGFKWAPLTEPRDIIADDDGEGSSGLLDDDEGGDEGGNNPATDDQVTAVLALLDPTKDDEWTQAGLPAVDAVAKLAGGKVTREQITKLAPDLTRESAKASSGA